MTRSKKIFLILGALFFLTIIYFMYDMSSKTTFPGSKPSMEEGQSVSGEPVLESDTVEFDSGSGIE